jgi:hypothetical protein
MRILLFTPAYCGALTHACSWRGHGWNASAHTLATRRQRSLFALLRATCVQAASHRCNLGPTIALQRWRQLLRRSVRALMLRAATTVGGECAFGAPCHQRHVSPNTRRGAENLQVIAFDALSCDGQLCDIGTMEVYTHRLSARAAFQGALRGKLCACWTQKLRSGEVFTFYSTSCRTPQQ